MPNRLEQLLEPILDRQSQDWLAGTRPSVRELLVATPLSQDPEAELDLIYNEVLLREELGEKPAIEEYTALYPHLSKELKLQFEVHHAMDSAVLAETPCLGEVGTVPNITMPEETFPLVPDYELLEVLGRGGMGVVYKARHRRLRRLVALKMFAPGRTPSAREVLRFRTEAEAIARLQHPNIVQIFEIGECNNLPYLALELATRGTLTQQLQQLPFAPRAAAELIEKLARAVAHAHAHQIIHRDLKPANVLFMADDTPKLTDFGLAKLLQEEEGESARDTTRTGEPIGTPRYMAPEQTNGDHHQVGQSADIYALGNLLYECLVGQVPFVASTVVETLIKIRSLDPISPRKYVPTIPRDLETICLKCLEKQPTKRYASANDLADDLGRYLRGESIKAKPTPLWEHVMKWGVRHPTRAAMLGVALFAFSGGGLASYIHDKQEQERIATLRAEVEQLMLEGQTESARQNDVRAESLFQDAATKVANEPALKDYKTGVAGWLNHSQVALRKQQWKQRVPPREFDERRDDALVQSALLGLLGEHPVRTAREAVEAALELTIPDDAAWRWSREQLTILDADLIAVEQGTEAALNRLTVVGFSSLLYHQRRAEYLKILGRLDDARAEDAKAAALPPDPVIINLFDGLRRFRKADLVGAHRAFESVLDREPEHFVARLLQAICALRLNRPLEAKVGLTACIAQQPRFAWTYYFRSQCASILNEPGQSQQELERGLEQQPTGPTRRLLLTELVQLHLMHRSWSAAADAMGRLTDE